jgi:glycerate kinase
VAESLRVLIIPDKFKGTLTARQAAEAIAGGWHRSRPDDTLDLLPMSDGGDGFGEVMGRLLGARSQNTATVDVDHRPMSARWWWQPTERTAVIESAEVIGLAMVGPGDPMARDTFGLGAVLRAAAGASRTVIGVGGSATNDGGFGVARGLGWRFLDRSGSEIERWTDLEHLERIEAPASGPDLGEVIVAVDVRNPLLGPQGCSRVYGPQKGLSDPEAAERPLARLAVVVGSDVAALPGAGAAGGLGFGLAVFAGATLHPGFDVFAAAAHVAQHMDDADLVITGEGALDRQSFMGKGVGEVSAAARARGIPCLALVGVASGDFDETLVGVHAITPQMAAPREAQGDAAAWLARLAASTAAAWTG